MLESINKYNNAKPENVNYEEANPLFDNMQSAFLALDKRLDWLLGRMVPKYPGDVAAIGRNMAKDLNDLLDEMYYPRNIPVLTTSLQIFAKLTGYEYDSTNLVDRQVLSHGFNDKILPKFELAMANFYAGWLCFAHVLWGGRSLLL